MTEADCKHLDSAVKEWCTENKPGAVKGIVLTILTADGIATIATLPKYEVKMTMEEAAQIYANIKAGVLKTVETTLSSQVNEALVALAKGGDKEEAVTE